MNTIYDNDRVASSEKVKRKYVSKQGDLFVADAIDMVGFLPDKSIDLAIFDPAYESLEGWRNQGAESCKRLRSWFSVFKNEQFFLLFSHLYRVMKTDTHVYVFCNEITRDLLLTGYSHKTKQTLINSQGEPALGEKAPIPASKFKLMHTLIWDKVAIGMGYSYRYTYEFILLLSKGKRRLNDWGMSDILRAKRLRGKMYYPTEKPAELMWCMVNQSSNKNEIVLDMFCGSGVVPLMARKLNRKFVGSDISQKSIDWTIERLDRNELTYPKGHVFECQEK